MVPSVGKTSTQLVKEDLLRIAILNNLRAFQQEKHYIQTIALRSIYASTIERRQNFIFFPNWCEGASIYKGNYDLWFLLKKGTRFDFDLVTEKLEYYTRVFEKEVFMERIHRTEGYWEPELKPLVIGRLPRFELVYNDVKAVLNDMI